MIKSLLLTCLVLSVGYCDRESAVNPSRKWNELVFTQQWGYTNCLQFKDESHNTLTCRYEKNPSIWSVHGIWPTETGSFGPNFCTKVKFVEDDIKPIEEQLNHYWYEINAEKNGIHFWTHEWEKHGSCALESAQMDSELKYFQMGLTLRQRYDLYTTLKDAGIYPKAGPEGYSSNDVMRALQNALKANPHIQCYSKKENEKENHYLLAVEVCLDESFTPVDCDHRAEFHANNPGVYGAASKACPPGEEILYVDNFPKKNEL